MNRRPAPSNWQRGAFGSNDLGSRPTRLVSVKGEQLRSGLFISLPTRKRASKVFDHFYGGRVLAGSMRADSVGERLSARGRLISRVRSLIDWQVECRGNSTGIPLLANARASERFIFSTIVGLRASGGLACFELSRTLDHDLEPVQLPRLPSQRSRRERVEIRVNERQFRRLFTL